MGERRRRINRFCHRVGLGLAGLGVAVAVFCLVAARQEADVDERNELIGAAALMAGLGLVGYAGARAAGWFVAELVD